MASPSFAFLVDGTKDLRSFMTGLFSISVGLDYLLNSCIKFYKVSQKGEPDEQKPITFNQKIEELPERIFAVVYDTYTFETCVNFFLEKSFQCLLSSIDEMKPLTIELVLRQPMQSLKIDKEIQSIKFRLEIIMIRERVVREEITSFFLELEKMKSEIKSAHQLLEKMQSKIKSAHERLDKRRKGSRKRRSSS